MIQRIERILSLAAFRKAVRLARRDGGGEGKENGPGLSAQMNIPEVKSGLWTVRNHLNHESIGIDRLACADSLRTTMNASDASAAERLASTLKVTLESSLHNGQYVLLGLSAHVRTCVLTAETQEAWRILLVRCAYMRSHPTSSPEYERLQILAMEEDLNKALFTIRYIKNTYAPINKLPPELLASIATSVDDPFEGTDLQSLCAAVCSYWRNSLLAFPGIWSTINTENPSRTKLYLARSKKSPLHVKYGLMTPLGVFERHIIPEHDRLQSLSIPLSIGFPRAVSDSLVRPSKSLKTLDVWMTCTEFSVPTDTMRAISRFAPNITVLKLHIVTTKLSSLEFPALTKLTLCIVASDHPNPTVEDLVKFLEHSPLLETLDLRLPNHLVVSQSVGTFGLERLKSAVFGGHSSHENNYICITGLQHLILPKQPITVDVQTEVRTRPWDTSPLLSAIRLGDATFPRQSITEGVIHIKDSPNGFFGHVGICGEHDNRIGLNYIQPPDVREGLLWRFRSWFNPMGLAPLRGIQTLTLGFFEFASDKEQCIGVLRAFLRELDQVRVLKVYMMDVSLLVRILQPSGGVVLLPSLDELQLHSYNPPELNRCVAHEEGKRDSCCHAEELILMI